MKTVKALLTSVVSNVIWIFGISVLFAVSTAWGGWMYWYPDGEVRSYDDGTAIGRYNSDGDEYKVTVNDFVSPSYYFWSAVSEKYTLPQPSSTMPGCVWGGWQIIDPCIAPIDNSNILRLPSGAIYELCGTTPITGIWLSPGEVGKVKAVPKPKASAGKYYDYVYLTWAKAPGASGYMIRRGTSKKYSKSKVIAYETRTKYLDEYPRRYPKKKFYYWIVPCNKAWKGKADAAKYACGSTKLKLRLELNAPYDNNYRKYVYVGDKVSFTPLKNGYSFAATKCKWKITSGAKYATISKKGVLAAKKNGKVVIAATYGGKTAKMAVTIRARSAVDTAVFKAMASSYWPWAYFSKTGNDYLWSEYSNWGSNYIQNMAVGAGGIASVSGALEGRYFSGRGRFGSCISTGEAGVWTTTANFEIDVLDEFGAYVDSYDMTLTVRAYSLYGSPWNVQLSYGKMEWDEW